MIERISSKMYVLLIMPFKDVCNQKWSECSNENLKIQFLKYPAIIIIMEVYSYFRARSLAIQALFPPLFMLAFLRGMILLGICSKAQPE